MLSHFPPRCKGGIAADTPRLKNGQGTRHTFLRVSFPDEAP